MTVVLEPLAPRVAVSALRARGAKLDPTFSWLDAYARDHAAMFTVAKSAGFDILDIIFEGLLKALEEGRTFRDFASEIEPLLADKGWWGRKLVRDPDSGDEILAQLGSPRRLRKIFEINMRVSYATGHWERFERQKADRPFLRYVAVLDERTRDFHRSLHDLVLPVDHPFWEKFAPPNGWNCRCTLQNLSQADIDRLIIEGELLKFEAPAISTRPFKNKRTGKLRNVPDGIDPGWDYNPGQAGAVETARRVEQS